MPFEGGTTERMPLIIGEDRLIPGFEANLVGLKPGDVDRVRHHVPRRLPRGDAGRPAGALRGRPQGAAREGPPRRRRRVRPVDGRLRGPARRSGPTSASGSRRNALDRARHEFSDKIIEYAVANATIDLPDVLVDQEVEVMHDEFRATLARQGIAEPAYLKATGQTEADLHTEFRPRAEQRIKVLLVLSKIAEAEGIDVPDAEVEAQVELARAALPGDQKTVALLRVRARPQLHPQHAAPARRSSRRSSTAGSPPIPTIPPLPHLEDDAPSGARGARGRGRRLDRRHRPGRSDPGRDHHGRPRHDRDHGEPPKPDHQPATAGSTAARASPPRRCRPSAGETPDARPDGHRIHQPR